METSFGKGTLVPSGKRAPEINVSFKISQKMVETKGGIGGFLRPRPIVHSIAAEAGQPIDLGDFDLLVDKEIVRLKHVANDPEWLVLSSSIAGVVGD